MRIRFLDQGPSCNVCPRYDNKCDALTHIKSAIQSGEDSHLDTVRIAIPLSKDQFDIAVSQALIWRVEQHFTDLSYVRLLSSDPLFVAQFGCPYPKTAYGALVKIRSQYDMAMQAQVYDQRHINWFMVEFNRLDKLIEHYQKQINCD